MKTIVPTSKCLYNQFVVSNLHAFKANITYYEISIWSKSMYNIFNEIGLHEMKLYNP
jgi:hypothetical protein